MIAAEQLDAPDGDKPASSGGVTSSPMLPLSAILMALGGVGAPEPDWCGPLPWPCPWIEYPDMSPMSSRLLLRRPGFRPWRNELDRLRTGANAKQLFHTNKARVRFREDHATCDFCQVSSSGQRASERAG